MAEKNETALATIPSKEEAAAKKLAAAKAKKASLEAEKKAAEDRAYKLQVDINTVQQDIDALIAEMKA